MPNYNKNYIESITDKIQGLEELGGPDSEKEYIQILFAVQADIERRLSNVNINTQESSDLVRVLTQKVGNKRYLKDLEILLSKKLTNLSPYERQTLLFLRGDLNSL